MSEQQLQTIKTTASIEAADIPTMHEMPDTQYQSYIESHLLFSDPHGVIRAIQGEYPIACSKAQLTILINYLHGKMELLK